MIVDVTGDLTIVSTRRFSAVRFIDNGDTVVVRFIAADGREVAVMIPLPAANEMVQALELRSLVYTQQAPQPPM